MPESQSSLITNHSYDPDAKVLSLTFRKGGNVARYHGVEPETAEQFATHPSHGTAFHTLIRDKFKHTPG